MTARISLLGDIQLRRSFNEVFAENSHHNPWGNTPLYLTGREVTIGNLECTLTDSLETKYPNKTFNFQLDTKYAPILRKLTPKHLHLSQANNHSLDFGVPGLIDTMQMLDSLNITHSGAGMNLPQAQ